MARYERADNGSIPLRPSNRLLVELADTPDSKPGAVKSVTVRLRGGRPKFMCYAIRDNEGNVIGSYMPLFCFLLTGKDCKQEIKDTSIPCPKCGNSLGSDASQLNEAESGG